MNKIKRLLGFLWMISAHVLVVFMILQANEKISNATEGIARTNTLLQWTIILVIFIPVCIGFFIFGKYAAAGEYDKQEN